MDEYAEDLKLREKVRRILNELEGCESYEGLARDYIEDTLLSIRSQIHGELNDIFLTFYEKWDEALSLVHKAQDDLSEIGHAKPVLEIWHHLNRIDSMVLKVLWEPIMKSHYEEG